MGFFDRFLSRAPEAPLPELAGLLEARGLPGDLPGLAALAPGFEAHRNAPEREAWADAVAEVHALGLPLPEPWIDAQDHLLPELVPAWVAEREPRWSRGFIDGLSQRVRVGDQPIPEAYIRLWDQSEDEVLAQALDHLAQRSQGTFERLPSGVYRSPWRDGLDAARLLLPGIWQALFRDQHPFLAIPTPGVLLAAPQILLPRLVEEVGKVLQSGAPALQLALLERIGDKLVTARLQEPHPMSSPQRELKHLDLLEALRRQEPDLDPGLGRPAAVALVKTAQGRPMTLALWVEGAPTLLPETDLVGFASASGTPLGIYTRQTLPRIHELRGEAVAIWGPRRVRYAGFPTAEQIARLECFATPDQMKAMQGAAEPRPAAPRPTAPAGTVAGGGATPLPRHLRGAGLGVQDSED